MACTSEQQLTREALEFISKTEVFAFLSCRSKDDVLAVINAIRDGFSTTELREKVATDFLAQSAIKFAKSARPEETRRIQTMLQVSAVLLRKDFTSYQCRMDMKLARQALEIYDLIQISDSNKGLVYGLLRDCGKRFKTAELQDILESVAKVINDPAKCAQARNLLCLGYIEANGAELAFVALTQDRELSSVTCTTPMDRIVETLKKALQVVDVNNPASVQKAKAIFWSACRFPGEKDAKAAVEEVRPDLIGQLD